MLINRIDAVRLTAGSWLLWLVCASVAAGQSCPSCNGGNGSARCPNCPSPTPVLETARPWTLYWHDPCQCVDEPCLEPSCVHSTTPNWYLMGELAPLYRDQLGGSVYQVDGTTGQSVLQESTLSSEFAAGARVVLGRALGDWYRLEVGYLGSYGWDDSVAVRNNDDNGQTTGNLLSPFSDFGDPAGIEGFDFNSLAVVNYSSDLYSVELNLRRRIQLPANGEQFLRPGTLFPRSSTTFLNRRWESSVLLGVRYLDLDEQFGYLTQSSLPAGVGANNQVNVGTENQLIGAQIGLLSQFAVRRRGWLDVEIKGGIFQNESTVSTSYVATDGAGAPTNSFVDGAEDDGTSWMGEMSIVYNHQFAPSFTFRIGYNALVLTDLALASENFSSNIDLLTQGPVQRDTRGDAVYHGPSLGLVWTY